MSKHVHQFKTDADKVHVLATKLISTTVNKTKLKWLFEVAQKGAEAVIKGTLQNDNSTNIFYIYIYILIYIFIFIQTLIYF